MTRRATFTKADLARAVRVADELGKVAFWVAALRFDGCARLLPMTKDGRAHLGRNSIPAPWRLSGLQVTTMRVKA